MDTRKLIAPTRVLAISSHVVSGYVGNKIGVLAMQLLGCDVCPIYTVQYSNHTGYGRWKGTKASAQQIHDWYDGLRESFLHEFDAVLTGYLPGAEVIDMVGKMVRELREDAAPKTTTNRSGSFFWMLDPIMGDEGALYVAPEVVPAYQRIMNMADLIVPNQFEAELLTGIKITDSESLRQVIETLHNTHDIPHVVVTSADTGFKVANSDIDSDRYDRCDGIDNNHEPKRRLQYVIGSTRTANGKSRIFQIAIPTIDCYFSGTGDLFSALLLARFREAVLDEPGLIDCPSWVRYDAEGGAGVKTTELPLARAVVKVVSAIHELLQITYAQRQAILESLSTVAEDDDAISSDESDRKMPRWSRASEADRKAIASQAAEIPLVRNIQSLYSPAHIFSAIAAPPSV